MLFSYTAFTCAHVTRIKVSLTLLRGKCLWNKTPPFLGSIPPDF